MLSWRHEVGEVVCCVLAGRVPVSRGGIEPRRRDPSAPSRARSTVMRRGVGMYATASDPSGVAAALQKSRPRNSPRPPTTR